MLAYVREQWLMTDSLIAPLGDHRKTHTHPSKGKKRKRKSKEAEDEDPPPPPPKIGKHILVGINSVTRHLEALAARNAPRSMPVAREEKRKEDERKKGQAEGEIKKEHSKSEDEEDLKPLSMIILTHPKPSMSPAHAHIPTLLHLSALQPPISRSSTPTTALTTRLIPLASSTDARLASALHIPRVGALAIFADAPGAKALEAFVQENVDVTECKWLEEAMRAEWKGLNVKSEIARGKEKSKKGGKEKDGETSGKKTKRPVDTQS